MELKKLFLSIVVVGMIGTAALAVAPIGPPVANLAEGQYAVGVSYTMSNLEVEMADAVVTNVGQKPVQNVEAMGYFGHIGYGISDTWCAHVALGMSEFEAEADSIPVGGDDFDGDSKFTYAISTKKTLHDNGTDTKWGIAFQYMKGSSKDTVSSNSSFGNGSFTTGGPATIDVDWHLMQLAMGPSIQVNPDVCVYGGPFLMFLEGDARAFSAVKVEVEQEFELGGFIGTVINLGGNAGLNLEFLFMSESWGAGVGVMFPL